MTKRVNDDDDDDFLAEKHSKIMKEDEEENDDDEINKKQKLKELRSFLKNPDITAEKSEIIRNKFCIAYFKKTLKENPIAKEVLNFDLLTDTREGIEEAYSFAKIIIDCEGKLKKFEAICKVFSATSSYLGRQIHKKYIVPLVSGHIQEEMLNQAFAEYQKEVSTNSKPDPNQCICYLIQEEMEKDEPIRIPHPLTNSLTVQVSAISNYIITLISGIAIEHIKDPLSSVLTSDSLSTMIHDKIKSS